MNDLALAVINDVSTYAERCARCPKRGHRTGKAWKTYKDFITDIVLKEMVAPHYEERKFTVNEVRQAIIDVAVYMVEHIDEVEGNA